MNFDIVLTLVFSTNKEGKADNFRHKVLKKMPYDFQVRRSKLSSDHPIRWEFELTQSIEAGSFEEIIYQTLSFISDKVLRYQVTGPKIDEDNYFFMVHWERGGFGPTTLHECLEQLNLIIIRE